jgi:predicted lipoprotein
MLAFLSCKKEKDKEPEPESDFDRKAMLENIGNMIIIPGYENLNNKVVQLDSAVVVFNASPDLSNLSALQNAFKGAYMAWQKVSVFEFGPAEQALLRTNTNTFPTDTAQIITNVNSGSYNLSLVSNIDAKGFPAIDYLLFGIGSDNVAILNKYVADAGAAERKTYLHDVVNEIKLNVNNVYNGWKASGGNYISTFVSAMGTDVGSSIGYLVNQLNYDFESLKNYKIGIPLGKKTLGTPLPEKTEAHYSGISVQLASAHLKAIEGIYLGRKYDETDGAGLDEYLVYLKSQYNSGLLSDAIKNQLSTAATKLDAVPDPLSETILNNAAVVDAAYMELQKQVVLFKTDMPSALGVLITYQDNDGD